MRTMTIARRAWVTTALLWLGVTALAGTTPMPAPVPVQAQAPPTATRPQAAPQRIISLVPALTEMLFAIGAGPQVVAVSSFDRYPPEVATRPRVGALLDPDVERVLSLTPDLVAIYGSQSDLRQQLQRASISVFEYRHAGLADVMATIRALGTASGHATQAEAVAADIERRLAAIRARTSGRPPVRTALVFGREPGALRNIYVSGGKGFLNDMLVLAGGVNVFADIAKESVQASTELLLTRAPDAVLEVREGPAYTEAQVRQAAGDWARLASMPAVKGRRVHVVSGEGVVVPGPRVAASVERLARALHPEAFAP